MAKIRGNAADTRGFFTSGRGKKPKETQKHTMTKTSGGRHGVRRVDAAQRVGVYKQ